MPSVIVGGVTTSGPGDAVGDAVGIGIGAAVGLAVGTAVGVAVGAGVGDGDAVGGGVLTTPTLVAPVAPPLANVAMHEPICVLVITKCPTPFPSVVVLAGDTDATPVHPDA